MFVLIVTPQSVCDTEYYTFSAIEKCIDFINLSRIKAIENKIDSITFSFNHCCIDDITIQSQFILYYNICNNNIYINAICNKPLGLTMTDDLTTEILYDLFKKNNFSIDDDNAIW